MKKDIKIINLADLKDMTPEIKELLLDGQSSLFENKETFVLNMGFANENFLLSKTGKVIDRVSDFKFSNSNFIVVHP